MSRKHHCYDVFHAEAQKIKLACIFVAAKFVFRSECNLTKYTESIASSNHLHVRKQKNLIVETFLYHINMYFTKLLGFDDLSLQLNHVMLIIFLNCVVCVCIYIFCSEDCSLIYKSIIYIISTSFDFASVEL